MLSVVAESEICVRVECLVGGTRGERDAAAAEGLQVDRPLHMFLVRRSRLCLSRDTGKGRTRNSS